MMDFIGWFLMLVGAGVIAVFVVCAAITIWEYITDLISDLKWRYKYKHRFNNPPTAKCYCIDCKWHNNETNRCYRFHEKDGRLTADSWFCYEAEPREKES